MPAVYLRFSDKTRFLIRNLLRGLIWLASIIGLVIIFRHYVAMDYLSWLEPLFENDFLIYTIYSLSELIFGIIPPELFMVWALRPGSLTVYIIYIAIFALISIIAGATDFLIGKKLSAWNYFRLIRKRYLGKYHSMLNRYGAFLILVAALTPLPYSGISMLMGSLDYPCRKYFIYASSRFLRYAVYAAIIWYTQSL
ncbi:MAG: VTT domain-containing protein [Bacteroidales bacterium]|nr:VTT domain-containing protein [Bacteroidales bacterium]